MKDNIFHFLGISSDKTGHIEKLVSGLGGFAGIWSILFLSHTITGESSSVLIVASMGATAV